MHPQIVVGQDLTLNSSAGVIRRIAVQVIGNIVLISRREEYEMAKAEGREPISVGFPLADVLHSTETNLVDTSVLLKHNVQYEQAEHGQADPDSIDVGRGQQSAEREPRG